ncbi:hypothetical protein LINPERPRIM_LOCUS44178 [Linum perenne]
MVQQQHRLNYLAPIKKDTNFLSAVCLLFLNISSCFGRWRRNC